MKGSLLSLRSTRLDVVLDYLDYVHGLRAGVRYLRYWDGARGRRQTCLFIFSILAIDFAKKERRATDYLDYTTTIHCELRQEERS